MEFRRTGRLLIILFVSYVPIVGIVWFALDKLVGAEWALAVPGGTWMILIVIVSVKRLVAYYRWTGKRPHL